MIPGRRLFVVPRFGVNNVPMITQAGQAGLPGFRFGGFLRILKVHKELIHGATISFFVEG